MSTNIASVGRTAASASTRSAGAIREATETLVQGAAKAGRTRLPKIIRPKVRSQGVGNDQTVLLLGRRVASSVQSWLPRMVRAPASRSVASRSLYVLNTSIRGGSEAAARIARRGVTVVGDLSHRFPLLYRRAAEKVAQSKFGEIVKRAYQSKTGKVLSGGLLLWSIYDCKYMYSNTLVLPLHASFFLVGHSMGEDAGLVAANADLVTWPNTTSDRIYNVYEAGNDIETNETLYQVTFRIHNWIELFLRYSFLD